MSYVLVTWLRNIRITHREKLVSWTCQYRYSGIDTGRIVWHRGIIRQPDALVAPIVFTGGEVLSQDMLIMAVFDSDADIGRSLRYAIAFPTLERGYSRLKTIRSTSRT